MAYTRPGVYITESPLKTVVSTNTGTATAAFVGINSRGPTVPTLISSWSSYTSQFGDLNPSYDLGYAVYQFFSNGGREAYVSRAVYSDALAATSAAVLVYKPTPSTSLNTTATTYTLSGTSASAASTYTGVTQLSTSGQGTGATFTITKTGTGTAYSGVTTITVTNGGTGYAENDTIVFSGALLGGASTTNNLTAIIGPTVSLSPLVAGSTTFTLSGTSASVAATYTGVAQTATTGTGTGATFKITKIGTGTVYSGFTTVTVINGGTGYAVGDTITLAGGSLGGTTGANNLTLTVGAYSVFSASSLDIGTYGNNLTVSTSAGNVSLDVASGILPTFNLVVKVGGVEVESWSELSPNISSSRYAPTIINNYSSYISIAVPGTVAATTGFSYTHATNKVFTGGTNGVGTSAAPADWDGPFATALNLLTDLPVPLLINAVGQSGTNIVKSALAVAAGRGDSFAIIDPDPTITGANNVLSTVATYNTDRGYGAVYYPMLTMADPSKNGIGAVRSTFPGGALAGIYARTEVERTVAKAPAGYSVDVRNAITLTTKFTEADIGTLYDAGVNTFKVVPGAGIIVHGARTLNTVKPDKYIPVRRTLNFVKYGIKEIGKQALFEPNDDYLWSSISDQIGHFLTTLWGQGGLKGRTPTEAFYIVCDDTNNTSATIENGEVNIQVGVSLLYPAEFIIINISQWLGGDNATENI